MSSAPPATPAPPAPATEAPVTEERPRASFTRGFPRDPALDALVAAFARGDYGHVRAEAPKLAAASPDDAVKRAARDLVARTEADPLAKGLLAATGAVLVILSAWWIAKGHPAASNAPASRAPAPPVEHVD